MANEELQFDLLRLKHLADNIQQDLNLLKEFEDALRYEDSPRRLARYRREIEQLQASAARYQTEYNQLETKLAATSTSQLSSVDSQLREMSAKLDILLAGETDIQAKLGDLRTAMLAGFDNTERAIIGAVVERLDQKQLVTTQAVLEEIRAGHIPEQDLQEALAATRQALAHLQQRGTTIPKLSATETERIKEVIEEPKADTTHKLKITVPIIPLLLSYEGEIGLQGGLNLKTAWERLVAKIRAK